jgi:glycosyltransferase involved in cell wall biosynthesis
MIWAYVRYLFSLVYLLFVFKPNYILYLPTSATLKGWIRDGSTLFIASWFKTKFIIQFRGGHFGYFYKSLKPSYQKTIKYLLQKTSLVLVQADVLKSQFIGIVPPEKIKTFYNSITSEFYSHFKEIKHDVPNKKLNILFIGHLSQAKGYCDLLKTAPYLSNKYNIKYHFIGTKLKVERNVLFNQATGEQIVHEDSNECYKHYISTENLDDSVEFFGDSIYGAEKLNKFKQADIFVLPSYSEGFSMSILEAMAAGLPIIATKVGAAPEIIENGINGYIINPGDILALQNSLEQLIMDATKRKNMGQLNREKCKSQFLIYIASQNLINLVKII